MNRYKIRKQAWLCILMLMVGNAWGQNTVSPYSVFGPGELQLGGFGTNQGMGNTGIALESGSYLNNLNPASFAGIDSMRILFEFGAQGKSYNLNNNSQSISGMEANLAYMALGFKYTPWMAGSLGLVPFSSVGYSINRTNDILGMSEKYTTTFTGSGGISRFYFANAVKLMKKLSLGVNVSYMFGPLTQDEQIPNTALTPAMTIQRIDHLRSFYFDFGMQYGFSTSKTHYSFGATYAPKQNLTSQHVVTAFDASGGVTQTETTNTDYLAIPQTIGLGIGVKRQHATYAFDYKFQEWSGVSYPTQSGEFNNSHRFSAGVEIRPWSHRLIREGMKNWSYRLGTSYESSYLQFDNSNFSKKEVTLGVGIPLYGGQSTFDFSVTGGLNGTKANNLTQEKYLLFNLGFSLNEIAFLKRVID